MDIRICNSHCIKVPAVKIITAHIALHEVVGAVIVYAKWVAGSYIHISIIQLRLCCRIPSKSAGLLSGSPIKEVAAEVILLIDACFGWITVPREGYARFIINTIEQIGCVIKISITAVLCAGTVYGISRLEASRRNCFAVCIFCCYGSCADINKSVFAVFICSIIS